MAKRLTKAQADALRKKAMKQGKDFRGAGVTSPYAKPRKARKK